MFLASPLHGASRESEDARHGQIKSFVFENIPPRAFHTMIGIVLAHGVEVDLFEGTYRCVAGSGTVSYQDGCLTITIDKNENHFSARMIKGGLRQLVSEAMENQPTVERTNLDAARTPTEAN